MIFGNDFGVDVVIQNGRRNFAKSYGTSIVKYLL